MPTDFLPTKRRIGRKRRDVDSSSLPVVPMELVSATYRSQTDIRLTFNQSIDPATVLPDGFSVFDGNNQMQYVGTSYAMVNPTTIAIELIDVGGAIATGIVLYADESNGIKAIDGQVWSGVSGLALPFG